MHGRSAIWFPLVLLALLAALTYWIQLTVQPPQPKRDGSSRHDPDYTVSNFVINKADRYGNPRSTLAAVHMEHFPDDDSTELLRPRYTQYSLRKPTVQIQGQRGQVTSNGENVYFMDNVKVVREATKTKGELTVLTEMMHIIPDQEIADTDRPVSILQAPHTVVTGTGMEMNNKLHTFKLFHRVHVHYERPGTSAGKTVTLLPPPPSTPVANAPKTAPASPAVTAQKPMVTPPVQPQKQLAIPPSSPQKLAPKTAPQATRKATKKTTRSKPRAKKTTPATEKSHTRIRRHYETSTSR